MIDQTPRYVPQAVYVMGYGVEPVLGVATYPPGQHPMGAPIRADLTAVRVRTAHGVRWYGFESAWIGSSLRMCVSGFPASDVLRFAWEQCDAMDAEGQPESVIANETR